MLLHPILQILLGCSIQQLAFLPVDIRISGFQVFAGFFDAAAARSGEGYDSLTFEVVCLHEGVDNRGAGVPPLSVPAKRGNGLSQKGNYAVNLYSLGVIPVFDLKRREKCCGYSKPSW